MFLVNIEEVPKYGSQELKKCQACSICVGALTFVTEIIPDGIDFCS